MPESRILTGSDRAAAIRLARTHAADLKRVDRGKGDVFNKRMEQAGELMQALDSLPADRVVAWKAVYLSELDDLDAKMQLGPEADRCASAADVLRSVNLGLCIMIVAAIVGVMIWLVFS